MILGLCSVAFGASEIDSITGQLKDVTKKINNLKKSGKVTHDDVESIHKKISELQKAFDNLADQASEQSHSGGDHQGHKKSHSTGHDMKHDKRHSGGYSKKHDKRHSTGRHKKRERGHSAGHKKKSKKHKYKH